MTKNEAIKAINNGVIAALILGMISLGFILYVTYTDSEGNLFDVYSLIDIGIIFLCAFGLYRKSRTAAIVLFFYYLAAKIIMAISLGLISGLLIILIFFYFFIKAIQGTYVFHQLEKADNPDYKAAPRWYYYMGIPFGLIFVALIIYGIMSIVGVFPSMEVLPGSKIPENQIEKLLAEDIISEDEQVLYFYSAGLMSIMEDGNLLTDQSVISYYTDENNELIVYEIPISEVSGIDVVQIGDSLNDSVYQISSYDEAWLQLFLSTESQGDQRFIEELQQRIAEVK